MAKTISRPANICNATWKKTSEFLPEKDSGYVLVARNGMFNKVSSNKFLDQVVLYGPTEFGCSFDSLYWIYMPE